MPAATTHRMLALLRGDICPSLPLYPQEYPRSRAKKTASLGFEPTSFTEAEPRFSSERPHFFAITQLVAVTTSAGTQEDELKRLSLQLCFQRLELTKIIPPIPPFFFDRGGGGEGTTFWGHAVFRDKGPALTYVDDFRGIGGRAFRV